MPLPQPIGAQRQALYYPATGHTVVLGTAGSGKTTLAILRSRYLTQAARDTGRHLGIRWRSHLPAQV
jgi:DNA helicase IV